MLHLFDSAPIVRLWRRQVEHLLNGHVICCSCLGYDWSIAMAFCMLRKFIRLSLLIALLVLSVGGLRYIHRNDSQIIALKPLPLDPDRPKLKKLGELQFLGAWELDSDNSRFGGISALMAMPDGRFIGLSDAGTLIGFGLTQNNRLDHPFIAPLPGTIGPDIDYEDKDSEGLAYDPDSGRFWVSFEGKHRIKRFTASFARSDGEFKAPEMRFWGDNSGAEAIVRMADGRFIILSEGMDIPGGAYMGLFFSGDPVERGSSYFPFGYRPPTGFKATDAAMLPDGRMMILNRRIGLPDGFRAKLTIIDPDDIARDEIIEGKTIATLASPLLVDNMEGLAITQENGRTIIWMISDDNFNAFQRTIFMKFALAEKPKATESAKKPEAEPAPGFESL